MKSSKKIFDDFNGSLERCTSTKLKEKKAYAVLLLLLLILLLFFFLILVAHCS